MTKKHKSLTIEELRKFKGFAVFTDKKAEEKIKIIEKLSIFYYELHMKEKYEQKDKVMGQTA